MVDRRGGEHVAAGSDEQARDADESDPFTTLAGEFLGTPTYMAPEQALGLHDEVGRHSDVYSVGAMLYQLLARQAPYANAGEPCTSQIALARVAAGPRRVVGAHETGAWAEARKWVARNRSLAAALAVALVFLVGEALTSLAYANGARRQSVIARAHASDAVRNSQAADAARALADANAEDARRNEISARTSEAEARASEQRAKRVTEFVQAALIRSARRNPGLLGFRRDGPGARGARRRRSCGRSGDRGEVAVDDCAHTASSRSTTHRSRTRLRNASSERFAASAWIT